LIVENYFNNKNFMKVRKKEKYVNSIKEKNNYLNYTSFVVALIGVLLPMVYFLGVKFREGILSVYGIDPKLFQLDTVDIYIHSYYAISYYLFDYLKSTPRIIFFIICVFILYMFVRFIVYFLIKILSNKNVAEFLAKPLVKQESIIGVDWFTDSLLLLIKFFLVVLITMLFGMLWIFIPQNFYTKGQLSQSEDMIKYHELGCEYIKDGWSICTQVHDENDTKIFEGLLISKEGENIAFYQKNGSHIFRLKSNEKLFRRKIIDIDKTEVKNKVK